VKKSDDLRVLSVAGFGPITRNPDASRRLYGETLSIPLKEGEAGSFHTEDLNGVKHFALWPLSQVAESCFGRGSWPGNLHTPQAWIEFEVDDLEAATADLETQGYRILVRMKKELGGQIVTRFVGPEGLLVGITLTPRMRETP
jgi:catechol 2,3-dioxygenase-like lactoylglutathione lyase family enzyme